MQAAARMTCVAAAALVVLEEQAGIRNAAEMRSRGR
jgi:hypothetical protein